MVIRSVIFDLGGVLVKSPIEEVFKMEEEWGLPKFSLMKLLGDDVFQQFEKNEISFQQFCDITDAKFLKIHKGHHFIEQQHHNKTSERFSVSKELIERIEKTALFVQPKMIQLAKFLRENGLVTGVITNNWYSTEEYEKMATEFFNTINPHFDFIIQSRKIGIRKPDTAIFALAFQEVNSIIYKRHHCKSIPINNTTTTTTTTNDVEHLKIVKDIHPSHVLFLDDIGKNLKGAKEFGFKTIKVVSEDQAMRDVIKIFQQDSCEPKIAMEALLKQTNDVNMSQHEFHENDQGGGKSNQCKL